LERRKVAYILLLMLTVPGLALPVAAQTNPVQSFANNLLAILPPVLFILSLLALSKADYEYAFTLLIAAVVATAGLGAFQGNVSYYGLLFYHLPVTIVGPTTTTVNSSVSYHVVTGQLPSGWAVQSTNYVWLIYYNSSICVYNSSSGYVNTSYVTGVNSSQDSLSFTPTQVGTYLVTYGVVEYANVSGYTGVASGSSGASLQVNPPPSPLDWITGAIESALSSFVATQLGTVLDSFSLLGQAVFDVLSYALTLPTVSGLTGGIVQNTYNELVQISIGLSLLFLAGSVAYNALKLNYTDLIDIASDLFYKIGVWALFTFGGLEIYNYVAIFLNSLIYEIINPVLPLLGLEVEQVSGIYLGLGLAGNGIGFGFGRALGNFVGDLFSAMVLFATLVIIRYFLILAIVTLIPLLATLWVFEWTRGIANMLVDVLVGLALAGLLNTIILTLVVTSFTSFLFLLLPLIADLGTIISLVMSLVAIRPHERLSFSPRRGSGSPSQPTQTPTSQTVIAQVPASQAMIVYGGSEAGEKVYYI